MGQRLAEEQLGRRATAYSISASDDCDDDDLPAAEMEDTEECIVDQASAAQTIAELEAEIRMLKNLEHMADSVRQSGTDRKWDELSKLLQDDATMFEGDGTREKLIIFTEHRDTLRYLTDTLGSLLVREEAVVTIYRTMPRSDQCNAEESCKRDTEVGSLIATDAAA